MNAIDKIKRLDNEIDNIQKYKNTIQSALEKYPDLEVRQNRWKNEFLISSLVNSNAEGVDIVHSCGCCSDSPVIVRAYLTFNNTKVYSNPFEIVVGEKNPGTYTDDEYPDWEDRLTKHNISNTVIEKVRKHFEKQTKIYRGRFEYT